MYFGTGWPKCFENPSHEAIVGVEYSSSLPSLLAVITSSSVFIWSGDQHRVLLGFLVRDSLLVEQEGANKALVWKKDASMIGVCVGFFLFSFPILPFAIQTLHQPSSSPSSSFLFLSLVISSSMANLISFLSSRLLVGYFTSIA
jgi:hypothetical protein